MSEHQRLQRALDLVYRIEQAPDIDTLNLWFRDVAGAFGVRHFAAVLLGRHGHPLMPRTICASSDPQWAERYYARNYFQIDPSVVALRRRTRPFAWSDVEHPEAPREVKALWHDVRANGDADGFNVPWHTAAGELGVVSLRGPPATPTVRLCPGSDHRGAEPPSQAAAPPCVVQNAALTVTPQTRGSPGWPVIRPVLPPGTLSSSK
jgi:hypothetical protein